MLQIVIDDAVVTITGGAEDLRALANWLLEAAVKGTSEFAFVHPDGVATWRVVRENGV